MEIPRIFYFEGDHSFSYLELAVCSPSGSETEKAPHKLGMETFKVKVVLFETCWLTDFTQ